MLATVSRQLIDSRTKSLVFDGMAPVDALVVVLAAMTCYSLSSADVAYFVGGISTVGAVLLGWVYVKRTRDTRHPTDWDRVHDAGEREDGENDEDETDKLNDEEEKRDGRNKRGDAEPAAAAAVVAAADAAPPNVKSAREDAFPESSRSTDVQHQTGCGDVTSESIDDFLSEFHLRSPVHFLISLDPIPSCNVLSRDINLPHPNTMNI